MTDLGLNLWEGSHPDSAPHFSYCLKLSLFECTLVQIQIGTFNVLLRQICIENNESEENHIQLMHAMLNFIFQDV